MKNVSTVAEVIAHLRLLEENEIDPVENTVGICTELKLVFGLEFIWTYGPWYELVKTWEDFDKGIGSSAYPVQGTWPSSYNLHNLWDIEDGAGGTDRRSLCGHMADYLEELYQL